MAGRSCPIDTAAIRDAARAIRAAGIESVGVSAVFSPLTSEAEDTAAAILREECPGLAITLSHDLGRIGLLARENVTLLNASLITLARRTIAAFEQALRAMGIAAPLYITQNDGTVVRAASAAAFPVHCFASGPTNSLRGAAFLSGLTEAVVIDIGGTTSDFGALVHGFPRPANNVVRDRRRPHLVPHAGSAVDRPGRRHAGRSRRSGTHRPAQRRIPADGASNECSAGRR